MRSTIIVKEGSNESALATSCRTVADLFQDQDFLEDFSVPSGAIPTVNGEQVEASHVLASGNIISWTRPVADKSNS